MQPAGDDAIDEEALGRTRSGSIQLGARLLQVTNERGALASVVAALDHRTLGPYP